MGETTAGHCGGGQVDIAVVRDGGRLNVPNHDGSRLRAIRLPQLEFVVVLMSLTRCGAWAAASMENSSVTRPKPIRGGMRGTFPGDDCPQSTAQRGGARRKVAA
jgi:hypothetical protein